MHDRVGSIYCYSMAPLANLFHHLRIFITPMLDRSAYGILSPATATSAPSSIANSVAKTPFLLLSHKFGI